MSRNIRLVFLLLLACPMAVGCIHRETEGETITVTYEWWVWFSMFFGSATCIPLGFVLRSVSRRLGMIMMSFSAIVLLGFAPSMFAEKLVLTESTLRQTTGFWGMTKHEVSIDNLASIRFSEEVNHGRRGRKNTKLYLVCREKDGKESKLSANNQMIENISQSFLMTVKRKGIPIMNEGGMGLPIP